MIEVNGRLRHLKARETLGYLFLSICLNSLSNGLTIATKMGSAVWTASAVNLHGILPWSLGTILFVYAILVQIINFFLEQHFSAGMIIKNLLFAFCFSYLVELGTQLFTWLQVPQLPLMVRIFLDILGIFGIALAISIYQRISVVMHPNDEFSYLARIRLFHNRAWLGQYFSYLIPVLLAGICYWQTGRLLAVGFGTIFALLFQGGLIGYFDQHIFKSLHHRIAYRRADKA
ncbi:hypothetical protein HU830_04165 [Lactobacillus sp. DCY120]|uniref:Integral membrane protein n=1 Tax=Bombilactobacillus apium TaxID=2675299 RepID=A0A850R6A9_9LACO|nr:hypothetical protein [Bombilactobacillus apium]NVY96367.1 hypothetical protein [Bombilactobacillus apium]